MSVFTRFTSWFGGNANTQKSGTQQSIPGSTAHEDNPQVGVDGALQVSTVWACVSLLAETISSLPLMTYKVDKDGNREVLKDDKLYRILHDRPNQIQTAIQFWMMMVLNLVLRGNAYARVIRDGKGEVTTLIPLSADQVETVLAKDGSLVYVYRFDNEAVAYAQNDILHIYGLGNGVVGMSPLDYMAASVGLAVSAQNHTNKTFRKNARRPGVLMSDAVLNDKQRQALRGNFSDIVSGKDKELYILEAQFKFEPLGMSPADVQLLESRQFSVQDLARWFGVPSVLINDNAQSSALGSSVFEIIQAFYKLRLRPKLELIEQCIQERVLTPKQRANGIVVEFDLTVFLRMSEKDMIETDSRAVQNGLKTRNESRKKRGLPDEKGGDILTVQSNLMPIDMLGKQDSGRRQTDITEPIEQ